MKEARKVSFDGPTRSSNLKKNLKNIIDFSERGRGRKERDTNVTS